MQIVVGGSSKMIDPRGISMPLLISSRTVPLTELYVLQSTNARSTSSKRLSA
jgi:type IV secretory pathway protease TraF